jgi:hypothetical protein
VFTMRIGAAAALIGLAGCATVGLQRKVEPGTYHLISMDGQALPVASPDPPGVTVHSMSLELTPSEFDLNSTYATPGNAVQSAPAQRGPYEVRSDSLLFRPTGSTRPVIFTFTRTNGDLALRDQKSHVWLMRRR